MVAAQPKAIMQNAMGNLKACDQMLPSSSAREAVPASLENAMGRFNEAGDGASMKVPALPNRSTMRVDFESSYRCRTRSPYIARTWKSCSRLDHRRSPHTTDIPGRAQLPETRRRASSCRGP